MTPASFDVFVSYAHADAEEVAPLVEALSARGLSVWQDEQELADFQSIDRSIREGLANSKTLVAYYSATYPSRRACQWELTAAFLAGQRSGDPRERVLVVNPEPRADHIYPLELQDARHADPSRGEQWAPALADSVARHVGELTTSLATRESLVATPRWVGGRGVGSTGFVGRFAEMWRIHSALQGVDMGLIGGSAQAAQVRGLGGMGKSLLAEEYALRFGAAYPGGVFWLRAYGGDGSGEGLSGDSLEAERDRQTRALASGLGLQVDNCNPEQTEAALAGAIEERGRPCLWVVDDVPAGLDADGLRPWLAPHPLAKTLLTTRSREYARIAEAVDLGGLPAQEALELLTADREPSDEEEWEAARGLVSDLGAHPLALEVAGAALASMAGLQSFAEFREALAQAGEDELELAGDLADALPTGHETSIAATLRGSLRQLGPEGTDVLRLASVLAPAPIPARLIEAAVRHAEGGADGGGAARRTVVKALRDVQRLSLAETPKEGQWQVHALVARTVRFTDEAPERREALRHGAMQALSEELDQLEDARVRARVEPSVPHARELAEQPDDPDSARLLGWVALYDLICGNHASGLSLRRRQSKTLWRLLGAEHPDTLGSIDRLGRALWVCGDYAGARSLGEQVVEARSRVLGDEHPNTLESMEFLAIVMSDQGDTTAGLGLLEQLRERSERVLGPDHRSTLRTIQGLAWSLYLRGDYQRARELGAELVERQSRVLGPDHAETLQTEGNLALTLRALGELETTREIEERLLEQRRSVLGTDSTVTQWSANNLACIRAEMGDLDSAREQFERTLETARRTQGPESPEALTAQSNLALTLCGQGELEAARELATEALETRHRTLGEDHRETLETAWALATVHWRAGALDEALALDELSAQGARRILGDEHSDTAMALANLALSLAAAGGNGDRAAELAAEAAETLERRLGKQHPDALAAQKICAEVAAAAGGAAADRAARIVHWRGV